MVTQATFGSQKKQASKTAKGVTKQGKKALSSFSGKTKKATKSAGSGEWYGPGRPGWLGEALGYHLALQITCSLCMELVYHSSVLRVP